VEIITTHKSADFDAVASMVAATMLYPDAVPVLPKLVNPNVRGFLSIHKDLFDLETGEGVEWDEVTKLIVVDANCWDRLDWVESLKERKDLNIHLWDHHNGEADIPASWRCVDRVGATTTLMVQRLGEEKKIWMSPMQATLFLAGIYEDTGNLTFPSTTAQDAAAVAFLLDRQADLNVLKNFLRATYGPKQKEILFEMLKQGQRRVVNGYRISIGHTEVDGHIPGLSVVVHMYLDIMNVDAAFGIFVEPRRKRCMVIGRSAVEGLNVGSILRSMGGGGHPAAGSAVLKSVKPEALEQWILELVEGNQQSSVQVSDLMSFPVVTVQEECTMREVAALLDHSGHSGMPVIGESGLMGVISKRDFKKVKRESHWDAPVKAFMSRKLVCIEPGNSPMKAARIMLKHDIGRLPVVEGDQVIGIVTRSDVMTYFYDLLPD